jgi:thymidylate kinase
MKRHTLFWFFQLAGRRRFLAKRPVPGEVLVIDDGFLHRSVALHASPNATPDLDAVARYVERIVAPDLVVAVHASPGTCVRRIGDRGPWRHRRDMSEVDLERYIAHADEVVRAAERRARELGWSVVGIDNDAEGLDRVRADLRAAVEPLFAGEASA